MSRVTSPKRPKSKKASRSIRVSNCSPMGSKMRPLQQSNLSLKSLSNNKRLSSSSLGDSDNECSTSNTTSIQRSSLFVCVGRANVKLRFCCGCYDMNKNGGMDMYYVDKSEISQTPTVLCQSCLEKYCSRLNPSDMGSLDDITGTSVDGDTTTVPQMSTP